MREVRYRNREGVTRTGTWTSEGVRVDDQLLQAEEIEIRPPSDPSKIIGVGPNYYSNIEHYNREVPESPSDLLMFVKTVPNSLVSHGGTARLRGPGEFHFEGEIGVVIGERCRNVPKERAEAVIKGYTCINEITNKGVSESRYDQGNRVRSKSFDDSAPVGPAVATPEFVPDDAVLEVRVGGERRQRDRRSELIHAVPTLIEEISSYLTLEPGDIIATGSPEGVGPLSDGDTVEVEVEGVGTLEHDVEIE